MQATDFVVARNDLQQCKVIETQLPDAADLPNDALLVKVTRFAFTANNVTYAVMGDVLKYWQLFPAPKDFGNIPVWGFGEVIASKHPNIVTGEILFGSTGWVVKENKIFGNFKWGAAAFSDPFNTSATNENTECHATRNDPISRSGSNGSSIRSSPSPAHDARTPSAG